MNTRSDAPSRSCDGSLIDLTTGIVSAYVKSNALPVADLPDLVRNVHAALERLTVPPPAEAALPVPPVAIRKTVTPDAIISLEDGKPYKSLKRHLTARGLIPEQYREKWGLPATYPMVAETYAQRRSDLARTLGLGQFRSQRAAERRAAREAAGGDHAPALAAE
ncbi:MucR family transcriptional regulator [Methylobacterium sp. ID0610]|uniref:MucR family transcriptional regulator n=1 Tax=Methylobacterium carpenticola TaxID=3344827 RepID=UPI00369751BD